MNPLPTVPLGNAQVTRLICGGNPFRGNSHQSPEKGREMLEYFTVARVKDTLRACERQGINACQMRGDVLIQAIVREFRAEGGRLHWIVQTASELRNLRGHVEHLAEQQPLGIYLHGTWVDAQFHEGRPGEVEELLKVIRGTGVAAGLGSHRPDIIAHAEDRGWDLDFYMCSLYNLSKTERESALVSGKQAGEDHLFHHDDKWAMFEVIRQVSKTCLAFKLLGAGRLCASQEEVGEAFATAFQNIKPTDAVVVGMFPKHLDQVTANIAHVRASLQQSTPAAST